MALRPETLPIQVQGYALVAAAEAQGDGWIGDNAEGRHTCSV